MPKFKPEWNTAHPSKPDCILAEARQTGSSKVSVEPNPPFAFGAATPKEPLDEYWSSLIVLVRNQLNLSQADAKESYPKDVSRHGYAASASDGLDGQCYRGAYNAAYDKARKGAKGKAGAAAAAAPAPKGKKFTKNLFSPASGVVCDILGMKYCADGTDISASFTEQYLEPDAAKQLAQDMAGADMSSFVLRNRVECRTKENTCFKSKGSSAIDPVFTKILFP